MSLNCLIKTIAHITTHNDTNTEKINKAIEIGANKGFIFTDKQQVLAELRSIYKMNSPTVAIDTSGQPSAIEICYEVSDKNARVMLVGVPKIGSNVNIYTLPLHLGKSIKGSKGGDSNPAVDIPLLSDLISSKKLNFSDFHFLVAFKKGPPQNEKSYKNEIYFEFFGQLYMGLILHI